MWNVRAAIGVEVNRMPTTNDNLDSSGDRGPLLRWLIFTGLSVFAFVLLWRFGLIRQMVAGDRTYLSSVIALLYVAASLHCLWRTIVISREADAARRGGALIAAADAGGLRLNGDAIVVEGAGRLPRGLVSAHIHDLAVKRGCRVHGGSTRHCCCAGLPAGCAAPTSSAPSPAIR